MNGPDESRRNSRLAAGVLFGLFALFYGRFLAGQAPVGGDIVNQYLPYQQLVRNAIHQGAAPLWNSFTFLGRPLMADIQIGVLYPPNWLHWFLPLPVSFALVLALHGGWMMLGCWRLGRAWGLHPAAAALGGVLWCAAPFFTLKLSTGVILFTYVGAWWPWMALTTTRLVQRPGFKAMLLLALTLALSLLAGSPQLTFYGWIAALAIGAVLPSPGAVATAAHYRARAGWIAAGFVVCAGLTAVQTFQTYHFIKTSFERGTGADWSYVTDSSLDPKLLWLLANPAVLGVGASDRALYWGANTDFAESCFYAPLWVLFALLPAGYFAGRSKSTEARLHARLAALGVIAMIAGLALALGGHSFPFRVFFEFVPGFDRFRVPIRLMVFWSAGLGLLSALAAQRLIDAKPEGVRKARLAGGIGLGLAIGATVTLYLLRAAIWRATGSPFAAAPAAAAQIDHHLLVTTGIIFAGIVVAGVTFFSGAKERNQPLCICLLAVVAAAELAALAWPFQKTTAWSQVAPQFYPKSQLIETLHREHRGGAVLWLDDVFGYLSDQNQPEALTNRLLMQGLPDARGYDPVNAKRIGVWYNLLAGRDPRANPAGFMFAPEIALPAWLPLMGIETILSYQPLSDVPGLTAVQRLDFPPDPELPGSPATTLTVYRNDRFMGRAFAAPRPMLAPDWQTALIASARRGADPTTAPLATLALDIAPIAGDADAIREIAGWTPALEGKFDIDPIESGPNAFAFRVNYPHAALLCLAQSAYEGWTATVDGAPTAFVTDYSGAFVATPVPAGAHEVVFRFIPTGLAAGRTISLLTLLGLLLCLAGRRRVWRQLA